MKNSLLIIIFFAISNTIYTQTLEETIRWIAVNAVAPKSLFRNSVVYEKQTKKLLLYKNFMDPFKFGVVTEINPELVNSITLYEATDKVGLKGVSLNFKNVDSCFKVYYVDNDLKINRRKQPKEKKLSKLPILAECNLEQAKKIKKAYIHLFEQLGISVKDGDAVD